MPGFDGTGPMENGQGMNGERGRGACSRGFAFGRGRGQCARGMAFGRGAGRCGFVPTALSLEEQKKILNAQLAELDVEKAEIEAALKGLGKK